MNPIVKGWYADPEAQYFEGKYWIYAIQSNVDPKAQMNVDAFSSEDLYHWEKHENIIDLSNFPWIYQSVSGPTIIEKDHLYYLVFASNDIQSNDEIGGIEIAVSNKPEGPFKAYLTQPLIGKFINNAQPIDAHLYKEEDNIYLLYGGWGHCNLCLFNEHMTDFRLIQDKKFIEITPPEYVEAPCMLKKDGLYHMMWSSGNWVAGSCKVLTAVSKKITGPFEEAYTILQKNDAIANGPGHHSYIIKDDQYHIIYHRRIIGDLEPGHRILCIDKLNFKGNKILPVKIT